MSRRRAIEISTRELAWALTEPSGPERVFETLPSLRCSTQASHRQGPWRPGAVDLAHGPFASSAAEATSPHRQAPTANPLSRLLALSLGEFAPARWSDVSLLSASAALFLLVFDSLVGFMLFTRLLASAPAPLVSTYAYVTPLVGAVIGAMVLGEPP